MQNNINPPCDLAGYIQRLKLQPLRESIPIQNKTIPITKITPSVKLLADVNADWILTRDNYLNHIMACRLCVVAGLKQPRYCQVGEKYYQDYQCATHELIECQQHSENTPQNK
ncbi:hypothetical protein [Providencia sp.]|uniref:hypothetical protein n=1 Tax=Providencia sp. TaxID=589 RepID=UPI0035B40A03